MDTDALISEICRRVMEKAAALEAQGQDTADPVEERPQTAAVDRDPGKPKILILTEKHDQIDTKMLASFFGIVLLPFTKDVVTLAVRRVLIENGIIGEGFAVRRYGDLWCEMLKQIPSINGIYAESISQQVPSPYHMATQPPDSVVTKSGNKIPRRTFDTVRLFYTSDDPTTPLDTRHVRSK